MKNVIIFTIGAGVGSLLTWMLIKEKYKQIADEEIESVVQHFKDRNRKEEEIDEDLDEPKKTEEVVGYSQIIEDMNYDTTTNYSDTGKEDDDDLDGRYSVNWGEPEDFIVPVIIDPMEFGEREGYDTETLYYYSDLILANDDGNLVYEPEGLIGDALQHFGDYEEDAVYVRNHNEERDYEIIKEEKTYAEIHGELCPREHD